MIKGYIWMLGNLPQTCVNGVFYYWNPGEKIWMPRLSQSRAEQQFEQAWKNDFCRPAHIKFKRYNPIFGGCHA